MKITRQNLKSILVKPGHIEEKAFDDAVQLAGEKQKQLIDVLVEKGLITEQHLGQLLSENCKVPFVILENEKVDKEVMKSIPEPMARAKGVVAYAENEQGVLLGMIDPEDMETINLISKKLGKHVQSRLIMHNDLRKALAGYKDDLKIEFQKFSEALADNQLKSTDRDQITVEVTDLLLKYGYQSEASDIHIEPQENITEVRFRIDGVMHDVLEIPKSLSELMVARIKILSKLRIDEHQAAQDGKFRIKLESDEVDVRVSIVPVTKGENVVIRLLTADVSGFNLTNLGMLDEDLKLLQKVIRNPHGMILVSGPTGSGKTTSVYAVLRVLNTREVHISTIEDPVEYDIKGVSQIQVNPETNLTFAEGLRAIVRQDPDIIMVGEIRDRETADIAVNSAMTGHLVLSTMHANDAPTTLLRLLEMGIEPYLVASTVNIVIAQRLVRKICQSCRTSFKTEDLFKEDTVENARDREKIKNLLDKEALDKLLKTRVYQGQGCEVCGQTGYRGRIGVFELLEVTDAIRQLVTARADSDEVLKAARQQGMKTIWEDALAKVKLGMTSLSEILRVVHD